MPKGKRRAVRRVRPGDLVENAIPLALENKSPDKIQVVGTPTLDMTFDPLRVLEQRNAYKLENDRLGPLAAIGTAVKLGPKDRRDARDRQEVLSYAKALWKKYPEAGRTEFLNDEPVKPFRASYVDGTLWNWVKHLKPGGRRVGRPRKLPRKE